jgi:hypothetical protein
MAYVPEWSLPIFIASTMMPIWFHEFLWRTGKIGTDSYNAFHDIHFYDKKWRKLTCNPFYFICGYYSWLKRKPMFWVMTLLLIISLVFGYTIEYNEYDFHPFTPFYIINSIWWIGIIKDFVVFRNDAREGLINYEIYNN